MQELFRAALEPVNLFYTILLGFVLLYWLSVILGAIDLSALDIDFDVDADMDADLDVDADTDMEGETVSGWFAGVLHYFNFGKLPFMVILSIVSMTGWTLSILSNEYLGNNTWLFALAMFIPILFVSLLIAKLITTPLLPLFARMNTAAEAVDYIGRICRLRLPASSSKFGQAEVRIEGDSLLINVKTESDDQMLLSGDTARVIGKTEDGKYYLVRKEEETPFELH